MELRKVGEIGFYIVYSDEDGNEIYVPCDAEDNLEAASHIKVKRRDGKILAMRKIRPNFLSDDFFVYYEEVNDIFETPSGYGGACAFVTSYMTVAKRFFSGKCMGNVHFL